MPNDELNIDAATEVNLKPKSKFKKIIEDPYVIALGTGAIGFGFAVAGAFVKKSISKPQEVVFPEGYNPFDPTPSE